MTCTCAAPDSTVPPGGMGQSARCSRIFYLPPDCSGLTLDGTAPSGTPQWFNEQIVRIEINSEVASRRYGHDKSYCAQDSTKGLASWNGGIQTRLQCIAPAYTFHAGVTAWLCVYPLGLTNKGLGEEETKPPVISGYAEITRDPIVMNLEDGGPIEHNYEFNSKGWWNMPTGVDANGTFDCCGCCTPACDSSMEAVRRGPHGSFFAPSAAPFGGLILPTPKTFYQWSGSEWIVVDDDAGGRFMPGPMPQEPGKFAGEFKRVSCIAA